MPPPQGDQFSNTAPKIESAAHDFSITPARLPGENKPPSYLNDLANRDRTSGAFDKSTQDYKIIGRDDFPEGTNREIKESADEIAERHKTKASIRPAEIVWHEKPGIKKNESGVQDFFMEGKISEDPGKNTDVKRPGHIEPQQKVDWPSLKTSQKEPARGFNPVENKAAIQQAGRKNNVQKLVIGKITVEVLPAQSAPVKTPQSVNRRAPNTANNKISPVHKLSYGLGQL